MDSSPTNKAIYADCCARYPELPVFNQPWWLDAVCGTGEWDAALAFDGSGQVVGALPYFLSRKWGFPVNVMPPLTPFFRLLLPAAPESALQSALYSQYDESIRRLLSQLPPAVWFAQQYDYALSDWMPFYRLGYDQTTRYSYVVEDISNPASVFRGFDGQLRNEIRQAEQALSWSADLDAGAFYELTEILFRHKKMPVPFGKDFFLHLDKVLAQRQSRILLGARDNAGAWTAGIYLLLDRDRIYFLASARNPALDRHNGTSFLLWKAMEMLAGTRQTFDFEGSMIPGVEQRFRAFGGVRKPYFRISRARNKAWAIAHLLFAKRL